MAYLAEQSSAEDTAGALAAYITGNVASNLFGRLMSAAVTDHIGLHANFYVFAMLNLSGAALVYFGLKRTTPMKAMTTTMGNPFTVWREHLRNRVLRASFAIGFLILFAFIGTFTYVNFVLTGPPVSLSAMALGLVYFVFVPSLLTTPLAGPIARRIGARPAFFGAIVVAMTGLLLLLSARLTNFLEGLAMVGVGTFFAQAVVTGLVGRAAATDRASASGIYLACYYFGGIAGSAALGVVFEQFGWEACVAAIALSLALAAILATALTVPETRRSGLEEAAP
jgi:predicted MFS family arabinose efflux permease